MPRRSYELGPSNLFRDRPALRWLLVLFAAVLVGGFENQAAAQPHTHASLILPTETARPGDTVIAGVRLRMDPHWHIYWRNPGGSGIATSIEWKLPPGITAGEIQWPVPKKLPADDLTTFIYEDEVVLLVPLTIAPTSAVGTVGLEARVGWLECEKSCVPGGGTVSAKLKIGTESVPSPEAASFETWRKHLPSTNAFAGAKAWWEKPVNKDTRPLILEWTALYAAKDADFFPDTSDKFEGGLTNEIVPGDAGAVRLRIQIKKLAADWPDKISGLLVGPKGDGAAACEATLPISTSPIKTGSASGGSTTLPELPGGLTSLWEALLYAFCGGLLLNIMPCVLPVIALKILGFVNQSREAPQRVRMLGLVYGAGVLFSFLVLAALIIGVQRLGHAASWGMQLQNPQFVVFLTIMVTLLALNLFGVYEITLSGGVMGAAGNLASKDGVAGAFFNGLLTTVLATPCTAAWLGSALGFAFTRPPVVIILVFLTAGVGLAAPYVVLSWQPRWLKFLPKPGLWMEHFKIVMGFPMLATAVWLFTLATSNFGENADLWLGFFLVLTGLSAWIWGAFVQRGRTGKGLAMTVSVLVFLGAYGYILEGRLHWRHPTPPASDALEEAPAGLKWQRWSPEALEAARNTGRPVVVDFTAKWCANCQILVKPVLEAASVQARLKQLNAVLLLENSYVKDATVAAELNRYHRAGVPLVLVYPRDPNALPQVLPETPTPGIVLDALDKAAGETAPLSSASP